MVPCQRCFIYGTRRSKEMGRGGGFKVTIGGGGGGPRGGGPCFKGGGGESHEGEDPILMEGVDSSNSDKVQFSFSETCFVYFFLFVCFAVFSITEGP